MKRDDLIDWGWVWKELCRCEGISKDKVMASACAKESIRLSKSLSQPKVISIEKKITAIGYNFVELEDVSRFIFNSPFISSHIKPATHLYIFLATIGSEVEKKASSLMLEGDYLGGYIMDRIGAFAVESLAAEAEESLRNACKEKNLSVSGRFSPGYCDWPLEEQYKLDKILHFGKAGVSLTKACMMVPKKSISAMAAIGPRRAFPKKLFPCAICDKGDCNYRR